MLIALLYLLLAGDLKRRAALPSSRLGSGTRHDALGDRFLRVLLLCLCQNGPGFSVPQSESSGAEGTTCRRGGVACASSGPNLHLSAAAPGAPPSTLMRPTDTPARALWGPEVCTASQDSTERAAEPERGLGRRPHTQLEIHV